MWKKPALVFGPLASMFVLATIARITGWGSEPDDPPEPPTATKPDEPADDDDEDEPAHASVEISDLGSFMFGDEGQRVVIAGNNGTGRRHCEPNANVWVAGNNNHYELEGACGQVHLTGNNNDLKADHVDRVKLTGNNNQMSVGVSDSVALMGNDNTLRYRTGSDGGAPSLSEVGRNNRLIKESPDVDAAN